MRTVRNTLGPLLKRCAEALFEVHARAALPEYFGPYGAGAWWSR